MINCLAYRHFTDKNSIFYNYRQRWHAQTCGYPALNPRTGTMSETDFLNLISPIVVFQLLFFKNWMSGVTAAPETLPHPHPPLFSPLYTTDMKYISVFSTRIFYQNHNFVNTHGVEILTSECQAVGFQ